MKALLSIIFSIALFACGGDRKEKDLTNSEDQDISPSQTISPEEQKKKDSTSLDLVGEDTTKTRN